MERNELEAVTTLLKRRFSSITTADTISLAFDIIEAIDKARANPGQPVFPPEPKSAPVGSGVPNGVLP